MDTGPEAKAFADHYILAHMNEASSGKTYEEVSGEFIALSDAQKASPDGQALGQLRQTLFMGNTLRGLLLNAYAFATIGTIAGIAAFVSFGAAIVLLVLVGLGLRHARRSASVAEPRVSSTVPQPV
jgi:predicted lipid-binding transport protein (Tim44 family)